MKAEELMIGDCVEMNLSPSVSQQYYFKSKIEVSNLVSLENGYDFDSRPIPLTEEMLKANGFEDGGEYMTRVVSGRIVEICLMHNIPMYVKAEWSYCFPHPYYVHELQHTLRLCGLNELADNFVIS